MKKIELLVPAGNKESFMAAIQAGADAIYIGGKSFSARAFADNFTNEEIQECIAYAHICNVKVHVGINTIIYQEEWDDVLNFIDFLYVADVDAIIVADFGLLSILKERYPNLSVHVSTQLNTHNLWQIKLLENLHVDRIVLARETSLKTIAYLKEHSHVELEVFSHGALCVCYSGNCLHSSMIGKRSGNRGSCAQPCRMEYQLLENHQRKSDKKYFLSMKDLNTLEHIDKIIKTGISSIKIEGRMKSAEYVFVVTKAYREAIDRYYETNECILDYDRLNKLKLTFSREYTDGYLLAAKNNDLTNPFRPNHLGIQVGKIVRFSNRRVQIRLLQDVQQQDKIVLVQSTGDIAFYLSKIYQQNRLVNSAKKGELIEIEIHSKILKDALVYKVIDHQIQKEIQDEMQMMNKKVPIRIKVIAYVGKTFALSIRDFNNHSVLVKSENVIEQARTSFTSKERIKEQISKVKSTVYEIASIDIESDEQGMIPIKQLNERRREALEKLNQLRANRYHRALTEIKPFSLSVLENKNLTKKFKVKVHRLDQLQAISDISGIDEIYYDDLSTFLLAQSRYPQLSLIPVLPRVHFDQDIVHVQAPTYVISQYGDLLQYQDEQKITDLYLNVTNVAQVINLYNMKVRSITLSPELSRKQIAHLIASIKECTSCLLPLEMVVYGRYQTMITRHCLIAKELGYENKNCGACRKNQYSLLDRMNCEFPILTDKNCNVTILNSKTLHLIDFLDEIQEMGIAAIRLDFSIESPEEVQQITKAYLKKYHHEMEKLSLKDVTYGYYWDE